MNRTEKVRLYYTAGLWSRKRVLAAAVKGWITEETCQSLLAGGPDKESGESEA